MPSIASLLLIADAAEGVQAQQLEPFARSGAAVTILKVAGLSLDMLDARVLSGRAGIALQPHFRRSPGEVCDALSKLRPHTPSLTLLDGSDSTGLRWPDAFPLVDLYVKKQLLIDRDWYTQPSATGFWFADWCRSERGWDLGKWQLSASSVSKESLEKLYLAWSLGAAENHARLARRNQLRRSIGLSRWWTQRTIDINCLVQTVGPKDTSFYTRHRNEAVEKLKASTPSPKRLVGVFGGGIPPPFSPASYQRSLRSTKLCVSPFGWGEICHRDFEAAASGCLLIKPEMKRVESEPDIYRPHESYIPCRWDLADLREVCEHWLSRPKEAEAVARRAAQLFHDYLNKQTLDESAATLRQRMLGSGMRKATQDSRSAVLSR